MPEKGIRSTYSQCPFQIQLWDGSGYLGAGTGFFYEVDGDWFLVTNWHIVSGRDSVTKRPLDPSGRVPTYIKSRFATYIDGVSFTTVAHRVEIYDESTPLWFEHPNIGSNCDVIALPLSRPSSSPGFMHNAANLISPTKIPVEPGGTVFVIGFPMAISVGFGLPLWKSGYIASEPFYDVTIGGNISEIGGLSEGLKLPAFFIDSLTRPGMSGSPVFASFIGMWDLTDPYAPIDFDAPGFWERDDVTLSGRAFEFVGCYSGRLTGNEEEAALGLCWRKEIIELICSSKKPGLDPNAQ